MFGWLPSIDVRLVQPIIAGLFVALGWVVNGWGNRRQAKRLREERLRDYHKAIYAEIQHGLRVLWNQGEAEFHAAQIVQRMCDDPDYIPLIPNEEFDFVYTTLVEHIEVLPRVTIDAIVAYYSVTRSLHNHAQQMRGDYFRSDALNQQRRVAMYEDYIVIRMTAFELGEHALRLIEEYAAHGPDAAKALAEKLKAV